MLCCLGFSVAAANECRLPCCQGCTSPLHPPGTAESVFLLTSLTVRGPLQTCWDHPELWFFLVVSNPGHRSTSWSILGLIRAVSLLVCCLVSGNHTGSKMLGRDFLLSALLLEADTALGRAEGLVLWAAGHQLGA